MVLVTLTPTSGKQSLAYYYDDAAQSNLTINVTSLPTGNPNTTSALDRVYDMRNFTQLTIVVKNTHASQGLEYQIEECYKSFSDVTTLVAGDFKANTNHTNKSLAAGAFSATYIALFVQGINAVRVKLKASAAGTAQVYVKGT